MKSRRRKKSVLDQMTPADQAAGAVMALGALNWGLVGLANFDLVQAVLGKSVMRRAAYGIMGASAAYAVIRGRQLAKD